VSSISGIRLQFQDFADEKIAKDIRTDNREIFISAGTLCLYLADAETCDRGPSPTPRSKSTIKANAVIHDRSETPPDTLTSDEETKYQQEEDRAAKRAALKDPEYYPSAASD
jgi:hypothetical protein